MDSCPAPAARKGCRARSERLDALTSFQTSLTRPETQQRVKALFERGLQQDGDFEKGWPAVLGTLLERFGWDEELGVPHQMN